jgi:hypothetical protein
MGATLITLALGALLAGLLVDLACVRLPAARAARARRLAQAPRAGTRVALPAPRRGEPRLEITVAAILGAPELRAVAPLDRPTPPPGRGPRRVPGPAAAPDRALLIACWEAATRRRARLLDAAAVELGLARAPLHPAASSDPDPLLTAAVWERRAA